MKVKHLCSLTHFKSINSVSPSSFYLPIPLWLISIEPEKPQHIYVLVGRYYYYFFSRNRSSLTLPKKELILLLLDVRIMGKIYHGQDWLEMYTNQHTGPDSVGYDPFKSTYEWRWWRWPVLILVNAVCRRWIITDTGIIAILINDNNMILYGFLLITDPFHKQQYFNDNSELIYFYYLECFYIYSSTIL